MRKETTEFMDALNRKKQMEKLASRFYPTPSAMRMQTSNNSRMHTSNQFHVPDYGPITAAHQTPKRIDSSMFAGAAAEMMFSPTRKGGHGNRNSDVRSSMSKMSRVSVTTPKTQSSVTYVSWQTGRSKSTVRTRTTTESTKM